MATSTTTPAQRRAQAELKALDEEEDAEEEQTVAELRRMRDGVQRSEEEQEDSAC